MLHGAAGGAWDLDQQAPEFDFILMDHLIKGDPDATVDKWGLMITPILISWIFYLREFFPVLYQAFKTYYVPGIQLSSGEQKEDLDGPSSLHSYSLTIL